MIDLSTDPHPEKSALGGRKIASGVLRKNPNRYAYPLPPKSLKLLREKWPTATEPASGVSVYGFRYYSSQIGRWTSKDPIMEEGGEILYQFSGNNGVNTVDLLGLKYRQGVLSAQRYSADQLARDGAKLALHLTFIFNQLFRTHKIEYSGTICEYECTDGAKFFYVSKFGVGTPVLVGSSIATTATPRCPPHWKKVHTFHSHPRFRGGMGSPSAQDRIGVSADAPGYIGYPDRDSPGIGWIFSYNQSGPIGPGPYGNQQQVSFDWDTTIEDFQEEYEFHSPSGYEMPQVSCPCPCVPDCPWEIQR